MKVNLETGGGELGGGGGGWGGESIKLSYGMIIPGIQSD